MVKKWFFVSFLNLFIAGILGFILRILQYYSINFPYSNFLHTHSHIAMLGWLYQIFYILIYLYFIPKSKKNQSLYSTLFWITQLSIVGMFVSFPFQGYGLYSILFSTLHILCSYYFCYLTFKNLRQKDISTLFIKTALACMLFSTFGIWGLGITMGTLGKSSILYSICIQFFLHFQINGWFLLGCFALILKVLDINYSLIYSKITYIFYILVLLGIIFSFGLPLSWFIHSQYIYFSYCFGIICNIAFLFLFLRFIHPYLLALIQSKSLSLQLLYSFFFLSLLLKVIIQLFLFNPEIAQYSYEIKNLRIGFIHLETLGIYTCLSFILLMLHKNWIDSKSKLIKMGTLFFLGFYFISEVLLFLQGSFIYLGKKIIPNYFFVLSWSSLLFPLGILFYLIYIIIFQKPSKNNS